MRRPALWLLLTAVLLLLALPPVFATHCKCEGIKDPKTDSERKDQDNVPPHWQSIQRLDHRAEAAGLSDRRCYEKRITNATQADMTDVWWAVANFYRAVIFAQKSVCQPTEVPGPAKQETGPITVGPSKTPKYNTQIWVPEAGWPTGSASV
jgi:hypothetical protein